MRTKKVTPKLLFLFLFLGFLSYILGFTLLHFKSARAQAGSQKQNKAVLELGFERRGKIDKIFVRAGDTVHAGDILAQLNQDELQAQLKDARAVVGLQKQRLAQTQGNSQNSDISYALENTRRNTLSALRDAYIKADDAVRGKADDSFKGQQLILAVDSQAAIDLNNKRVFMEQVLVLLRNSINQFSNASDGVGVLIAAEGSVNQILDFLDALAIVVNGQNGDATTQTNIRNAKADLYVARVNLSTVLKTLVTAESTLHDAQAKAMPVGNAGSATGPNNNFLQTQIDEAQARVDILQAQLQQTVLKAPRDGLVKIIAGQIGMLYSGISPFITLQ